MAYDNAFERGNHMNRGAREANEESARMAAGSRQESILAEMRKISRLLERILAASDRSG
jgi:hypothetical protein